MPADEQQPFSRNYRDYVIQDGKFVGRFDDMYRHSSEVPWHQDETVDAVFSDISVAILRRLQARSLLDVGCGLGYMTARLHRELVGLERTVGVDVSETAVAQARSVFSGIEFVAGTIDSAPIEGRFDLVVSKDVLWYVIHQLDNYLAALAARSQKWIYLGQSFPETNPYYGDDVLPNAGALFRWLAERGYNVVYSVLERDARLGGREYAHAVIEVKP